MLIDMVLDSLNLTPAKFEFFQLVLILNNVNQKNYDIICTYLNNLKKHHDYVIFIILILLQQGSNTLISLDQILLLLLLLQLLNLFQIFQKNSSKIVIFFLHHSLNKAQT